jgi:hypothetical protein
MLGGKFVALNVYIRKEAGHWWVMPVILAPQEAENQEDSSSKPV